MKDRHTNANETLNDGDYEYEETGFPFPRNPGQAIYEVESSREKASDARSLPLQV